MRTTTGVRVFHALTMCLVATASSAVATGACTLRAQSAPGAPIAAASEQTPWREHVLSSSALKEERKLLVVRPEGYDTASRKYPVLILLDANDRAQFASAIANVNYLASRGAVPPMLIVGITNGADRLRDMTPPLKPAARASMPTAGGMEAFLDFIEREALPLVRREYRAAPYQVFAGHSLGGLTAIRVAGSRPTLAQGIVAMSPSLWVEDEGFVRPWADAVAARTAPLRLFITHGGEEAPIDTSSMHFEARLESALRSRRSTAVRTGHKRYPSDPHSMTPLPILVDGLRFVFADYSMAVTAMERVPNPFKADSATWLRALRSTEHQWSNRLRAYPAELMGEPAGSGALPESYFGLAGGLVPLNVGAATGVAARGVELYPNSASTRQVLGMVLTARGDSAGARGQLAKALELARAANDTSTAKAVEQALKQLEAPAPKRPDGR